MKKSALVAFVSTLLWTASGYAAEPFTKRQFPLSAHLGYGFGDEQGDLNPYGFGLGARGGYTFDMGLYLGGVLDVFFGEKDSTSVGGLAGGSASASTWLFQVEGGYDFGITRSIVIRPKLGLGPTFEHGKVCVNSIIGGGCRSNNNSEFSFGFGAEALFDVGDFYVAPELRYNVVTGDADWNAFFMGVGFGTMF